MAVMQTGAMTAIQIHTEMLEHIIMNNCCKTFLHSAGVVNSEKNYKKI